MDNESVLNSIHIYYQNVRGLRTKVLEFSRNLLLCSYDVIILTETWLTDGILDSELFNEHYTVWRRDRNSDLTGQSRGGGVLIATRKDLKVSLQPSFNSSVEDLWVTLIVKLKRETIKLHICVLYLCKQGSKFSFSEQLTNYLTKLTNIVLDNSLDKFLLVGDFNLSGITWLPSNLGYFTPYNARSSDELLLVDEMHVHDFAQYNGITNKDDRILDLVFSNESLVVSKCVDPMVPIDPYHEALCITFKCIELVTLRTAPRTNYRFNKGDYLSINRELNNIDWCVEFQSRSLEGCTDYFYEIVNDLKERYVPSRVTGSDHYPVWYSAALKKAIKEKYKYKRKYSNYGNKSDLNSFNVLRDRVRVLETNCYNDYIDSLEISIGNDPKKFWSYVKSKSKCNSMPGSVSFNNVISSSAEGVCSAFSNYFQSTFLDCDISVNLTPRVADEHFTVTSHLNNIYLDQAEIHKLILNLDLSKSAGPDQLPARFIVGCSDGIVLPIYLLFKRSLHECTVPAIWKSAFITPVHKKGSKFEVTNYRPISKLCIFSKIFERVIYTQVYAALQNVFNSTQHGFLKNKSTVSNLVILNDYLTDAMHSGKQVDVIYTDYSKAFDKINHSILISKLQNVGICGDLLRWFISYLEKRSQAVVINNYISAWVPIPSGVPQGSLLGPLLFIIFINDITKCFQFSRLLCFADDMKIFMKVASINDAKLMQSDLDRLCHYCLLNKLDLNPTKCHVVTYTRKINQIAYKYKLNEHELIKLNSTRDLGIVHDSKLTFDEHVNSIVTKASKMLGFVMRNSQHFRKAKTIKILYCTFVRSHLEYASQVWNPRYNIYIERIERIQRKFIKYLCFKLNIAYNSNNYDNLCKKHHLLPLYLRREVSDIIYYLKIVKGLVDCPELLSKVGFNAQRISLRHRNLISLPLASTNYRQNSFFLRVGGDLNRLGRFLDIDPFYSSITGLRRQLSARFFVGDEGAEGAGPCAGDV